MGKIKKQKPLLNLGRPANVADIFEQIIVGRVYDPNGNQDPHWKFVAGISAPKNGAMCWYSVWGFPLPAVANVLPPWAYSIMPYAGRLIVEDMEIKRAQYLCDCEPDFAQALIAQLLEAA